MSRKLDFINQNHFRKYPIQDNCSAVSVDGVPLPPKLLVHAKVVTQYPRVYLRYCQLVRGRVVLEFCGLDAAGVDRGSIGLVTQQLSPDIDTTGEIKGEAGGYCTFGGYHGLADGSWEYLPTATELEVSAVVTIPVPGVRSFVDPHGNVATGHVRLGAQVGLEILQTGQIFTFSALQPASLNASATRHSLLGNCPTPVIRQVNTAVPITGSLSVLGDLLLLGVDPVEVNPSVDPGSLNIETPELTYDFVCESQSLTLPPSDPDYVKTNIKSKYFTKHESDVRPGLYADRPEFTLWPQFIKRHTVTLAGATTHQIELVDLYRPQDTSITIERVLLQQVSGAGTVLLSQLLPPVSDWVPPLPVTLSTGTPKEVLVFNAIPADQVVTVYPHIPKATVAKRMTLVSTETTAPFSFKVTILYRRSVE